MLPISPSETLVETRICRITGEPFDITDADVALLRKLDPTIGGQEFRLPLPTVSPKGRHARRLSFRNERNLYKDICAKTGKSIVSMYRPEIGYVVYDQGVWWSDVWDPKTYGRDFDFEKSFFKQFTALQKLVPRPNLLTTGMENSEYTNYASYLKDCYLTFESSRCEKTHFGWNLQDIKDSIDLNTCLACENCYECTNCIYSHATFFSFQCENCYNCIACTDCTDCKNCLGCTNLEHKEYHIRNTPVSPEEFQRISSLWLKRDSSTVASIRAFVESYQPKNRQFQCENCTGNMLVSCKNAFECSDALELENARYVRNVSQVKDSMDVESTGGSLTRAYELNGAMDGDQILFSMGTWGTSILYCDFCTGSHLFGCVWLHSNESYCILNKQYTKEEYEALVPRIIEKMRVDGEWGEFFPSWMSPFGYNETVAMEYYPLSREEVVGGGVFNWSDYEPPFPKVEKVIPASKLPDSIEDVPDDILNWAIECEVTGKPFRIIKQELEFYRKHSLPIPRRHPDQRHLDRMTTRNTR